MFTQCQGEVVVQQVGSWNARGYGLRGVDTRSCTVTSVEVDVPAGLARIGVCEIDGSVTLVPPDLIGARSTGASTSSGNSAHHRCRSRPSSDDHLVVGATDERAHRT
jgi:hypothetical protein